MDLTITMNLDNAAFRHEDGTVDPFAVEAALTDLGGRIGAAIQNGTPEIPVRDVNGNTVGRATLAGD